MLMEEAPAHTGVDEVRNRIMVMAGVLGVSDLHVWTITSGMISLGVCSTTVSGSTTRRTSTSRRAS